MNRRSFLAASAALLLPSWLQADRRRPVDLRPFCRKPLPGIESRFGQMSTPFVQEGAHGLFAYATDGHVCVRADAENAGKGDESIRRPGAHRLEWPGDVRGWKSWPRQDWIQATDSDCHVCDGYGVTTFEDECEFCDGGGERCAWCQKQGDWCNRPGCDGYTGPQCRKCHGSGIKGTICPACKGEGIATRPGIQRVNGLFIQAKYDHKVRGLGECEYVIAPMRLARMSKTPEIVDGIKFRFDGGAGLLLPLCSNETTLRRIREAKS